jgi:hypothetical protein
MSASCVFSLAAIGNAANTSIQFQLADIVGEKPQTDKSHPLLIALKSI